MQAFRPVFAACAGEWRGGLSGVIVKDVDGFAAHLFAPRHPE
jgi:hypothetical protein